MKPPSPTWSRYAWFALGFSLYTIVVGIWGGRMGMSFWSIMPGCLIAGLSGGAFLSAATYLIKTGYMQRGSSFYRFQERPVTFVMDSLMIVLALLLSALWPVGYTLQETQWKKPKSEQEGGRQPTARPESK